MLRTSFVCVVNVTVKIQDDSANKSLKIVKDSSKIQQDSSKICFDACELPVDDHNVLLMIITLIMIMFMLSCVVRMEHYVSFLLCVWRQTCSKDSSKIQQNSSKIQSQKRAKRQPREESHAKAKSLTQKRAQKCSLTQNKGSTKALAFLFIQL